MTDVGQFTGTIFSGTSSPSATMNQLGRTPVVGDMWFSTSTQNPNKLCIYGSRGWMCTVAFVTTTSTSTSTTTSTSTSTSTSTTST